MFIVAKVLSSMTKQLLEYIVKGIVGDADSVEITQVQNGDAIAFKIKVKQEDRGRLIGREGRTIRSLRALIQNAQEYEHKHCTVELVD